MIRQRVISALCLAVLLIGAVLWLPPVWSALALSMVLVAAAWEWSAFPGKPSLVARVGFVLLTAVLCAVLWQVTATASALLAMLWVALLFWCAALLWVFVVPRWINAPLVGLAGMFALSLAWVALVRMRLDVVHGERAVLYGLLIVWVADSGAYFAGRAWGGRKLAPMVSPGKTWAGLWGGLSGCAALAALAAWLFAKPFIETLAVTLVVGVFSVVGDLTESLCKRFAGLKDSGTLIPGHGGVLDRFDSLLAALPLLLLGIESLIGLQG